MQEGLEELFLEFLEEGLELLAGLENSLAELEKDPDSEVSVDKAFRCIHTLKGNSACFELVTLTQLAHVLEDILGLVRDKKLIVSPELLQDLVEGTDKLGLILGVPEDMESIDCDQVIDKCKSWLGTPTQGNQPPTTDNTPTESSSPKTLNPFRHKELNTSNLLFWIRIELKDKDAFISEIDQLGTIHEALIEENHVDFLYETVLDKTFFELLDYEIIHIEESIFNNESIIERKKETIQKKEEVVKATTASKDNFARISYTLLDRLIELSGELLLCRNQFTRKLDEELTQEFSTLSTLINDMQDGLMMTRMQPFSKVSSKFPRMIRETARKLDKKVKFEVIGESIEMDRTILEGAKSIFTHLVRNSLDHGVEHPDERIKSGKNPEGSIAVQVSQNTGFVQFEIIDDGGGINPEKLKEKALNKNIITQSQLENMSDDAALNLIYSPGFSTAGNITDISGRGVGMDVVKTEVEKLGGSISLKSELGSGTTFTIKLPQSMAILHSLIINSNDKSYAIPRNNISEVIRVNGNDTGSFKEVEGSTLLKHRGRLLPLLDLNLMIENALSEETVEQAKNIQISSKPLNIIVIKQMEKSYGLIIDAVDFQEEIVIKPLNEFIEDFKIFTGMTILSTGKACFILDVHTLAEKGGIKHTDIVSISDETTISKASESFFTFENVKNEQFCIPIAQISMIHQVPTTDLAVCGSCQYIDILDDEYKIIDLADYLDCSSSDILKTEMVYIIRFKGIAGKWVIACKSLVGTKELDIDLDLLSSDNPLITGRLIKEQTVMTFLDLIQMDQVISNNKFIASNSKVLVVDDSKIFRSIIAKFLSSSGYEVTEAVNGEDALNKISTDKFELILSDLEMPTMNGFEFATALKEKLDIPILALSSLNSATVKEKAVKSGFDELIHKFDTKNLISVLKRYTA